MDNEALEAARAVAFHYFSYAARSQAEIKRRLSREEFAPEVIEAVISEFVAQGWLDDEKFAQDWIEDRADRKKYGKGRLAEELRRKGVSREVMDRALSSVDDEMEVQRARAAVGRRWRVEAFQIMDSAERSKEKKRCADYLMRRGFGWPIIVKVLSELMAKEN